VAALASPFAEPCVAQGSSGDVEPRIDCGTAGGGPPAPPPFAGGGAAEDAACRATKRLRGVSARGRGRGLRLGFTRRGAGPVTVDVFQASQGRRVLGTRRITRFSGRRRAFAWNGRRGSDGIYFVRFRARGAETQRVALRRRGGRFARRPGFDRKSGCGTIRTFKLERPVFGGTGGRPLGVSYRLGAPGRVTVTVERRGKVVRRLVRGRTDRAGRRYRLRVRAAGLRRGDHVVRLTVRPSGGGAPVRAKLTATRL
jgi:hypothetical protein